MLGELFAEGVLFAAGGVTGALFAGGVLTGALLAAGVLDGALFEAGGFASGALTAEDFEGEGIIEAVVILLVMTV